MIDPLSVVSLSLEPRFGATKIAEATGFAVQRGGMHYLLTNWHVVTGRRPATNKPLDLKNAAADPDEVDVWFHAAGALGTWHRRPIALRVKETGAKLWLEHARGREIDVVAVPFAMPTACTVYPLDLTTSTADVRVVPSEPLSIVGFPLGLTVAGKCPIWKTGHLASDMDLNLTGERPAFLIDATTKPAMSGSPVFARRVGGWASSTGFNVGGEATRFLGIYSGRLPDEVDASIGFVWKPSAIDEIFSAAGI